jgi:hypothetical protein
VVRKFEVTLVTLLPSVLALRAASNNWIKQTTCVRLDEYQRRRAALGEPVTYPQMLEELVEGHLPMPRPVRIRKKAVKSMEPMNERQRRNGRPTAEERQREFERRRALWTPRPPKGAQAVEREAGGEHGASVPGT